MDPIGPAERRVANRFEAEFVPFTVDGKPSPGQWILQLDGSYLLGGGFHVYRMDPGTRTTPHEHTCDEQFLMLEGELIDHDGHVYRPGDLVLLAAGTRHDSRTETGCTLAVFIATTEENLVD
jgi:mannose-6-phosphate isomerase-like protein (cupin superfamily)